MKRIIRVGTVALAFATGAAWAEQQEQPVAPATENAEAYVNVAQTSQNAERAPRTRQDMSVAPRKPSLHEETGLAGEGAFPSRGGPIDD